MRASVGSRLVLLTLLMLAIFASTASEAKPRAELRELKRPMPASDFNLRDLNGKQVRLSNFRGKVVLLNFWATWCSSCRKEMPSMQQLYRVYAPRGFEIVAVSVDTTSPAEIDAYVKELGLTFPVLHDRDSLVSRRYSNPGVPSSYLIDARGRVSYRVLGEYDWSGAPAKDAVEGLLRNAEK